MKKSEFERERKKYWLEYGIPNPTVEADVAAAEAAGVTWDPEEEPQPGQPPSPEEPKCPECGSSALRPKCLWEMGADCPRYAIAAEHRARLKNEKAVPEPVKLPERLAVGVDARTGTAFLKPEDFPGWRTDAEKKRSYAEAVRRYNEWPEMERQLARRKERFSHLVLARQRAEKAEAEVKRLGGVIDGYCRADTKLRADLRDALDQVDYLGKLRAAQSEVIRKHIAERDALKLAVQEGEVEVEQLRRSLAAARLTIQGDGEALRDLNEKNVRLRRRVALIQGFFSDDKEQFRESLRAILREREDGDGN